MNLIGNNHSLRGKNTDYMIHANPNPKMTVAEVKAFRDNLRRYTLGKITRQEKQEIEARTRRMNNVAERIIANNGGKNPILGY